MKQSNKFLLGLAGAVGVIALSSVLIIDTNIMNHGFNKKTDQEATAAVKEPDGSITLK